MRSWLLLVSVCIGCGAGSPQKPSASGIEDPEGNETPPAAAPPAAPSSESTAQGESAAPTKPPDTHAAEAAKTVPEGTTQGRVPPAAQKEPATPQAGQVTVQIIGLHGTRGQLEVGLYRAADGFPRDPSKAVASRKTAISGRSQSVVFDGVAPGPFAVAVHHDENGNGKMDTKMFGMPSEGYGFSRDAKASFGPPSFADARLMLAADQRATITVHMRY